MYHVIKRCWDILFSGVALILLIPIWVLAIIGIEVSDPGPVFYFAKRVTKDNRIFRMFKFRSMRIDKDANEKSLRPDKERIFPFGRVIRATKIDELPQLLNVLFGDMSIVGPRPASVDQILITRGGKNARVSTVKAGLTSPAAIYDYLYGDSIEDEEEYMKKVAPTRLALDLFYIENQNFSYDAKMIWYTIICITCTIFKKRADHILKEMIESVNGNRTALDEVKK